jgi:hypothetical protein
MMLTKKRRRVADQPLSIVALTAICCACVFLAGGTANASSTVQETAPANNAVVSGTISLSCSVPSSVRWINIDIDENYYASAPDWASSYTTAWNSASVSNGSHQVECNGYASDSSMVGAGVVNITVSNGSSTSASTPAPAPTPPPASAPAPSGCKTIPGTNTPVGAVCFPSSSYPALNNPHDPVSYGADKTGGSDSTSAISAALAAGDAYFATPGTYLVSLSNGRGVIPPAGRTIECTPGVTLIERGEDPCNGHDCGILTLLNGGNTVVGCDFQGGNSSPGAVGIGSNEGQYLIMISSDNDTIEGNTFENAWGDSAVQVNGDNIIPSNFLIQYNSFAHNAYYGPEIDVANSGTIQNNLQTDGGIGPEDGDCSSSNAVNNVTIKNNELLASVGDCRIAGQDACDGGAFITGGSYPPGCNYSSVTVANNYCQGNSTQSAQIENVGSGVTPAHYSNDILGPDCYCRSGSSC